MAGIFVGGVFLLWVTVAATYAQVAARSAPASALAAWPVSAEALGRLAEARLAIDASPASARSVRTQAQRALMRDPLNVVAARTASMAAGISGDAHASRSLLAYAQLLSRRDLGTQVALIEFAAADGNVTQALRHYDIALRGSDAADQLLMPVLVQATRDPKVATALQPMLATRPPWRMRFVYSLIEARPWAPTFMPVLLSARLSAKDAQERDFLRRAMQGLVADGKIDDAVRLYTIAAHAPPAAGIRNADFVHGDALAPFDWDLVDDAGLSGLTGPVDGAPKGNVLSLISDNERHGVVARQLLLLPSGSHILRFRAGAIPSERDAAPVVQLSCIGKSNDTLARIVPPPTAVSGTIVSQAIMIPEGCRAQWLSIATGNVDLPNSDAAPWLGWFAIDPA